MITGAVVVIGGTSGLGYEIARHYAAAGRPVVLSGRDPGRAAMVAAEIGGDVRGIGLDLTVPGQIDAALAEVGAVTSLVLSGIDRGVNSVADYDVTQAVQLATQKLVGYIEVVHALRSRLADPASIVVFGGQARLRPYPGSTMVSTVNGGVTGMVRTLSVELAPVRVNSIHPGIVGDSPFWADKPAQVLETFRAGTLTGQLATMADVVAATRFLLENPSVNGVDLVVDGGWR
ncbi:SDR family oxidoreductase [Natronosporangium hydrolyticum]|uniref:SDR family oxidoreductase n=1 Tax=Natronosporangium hydrolyticum TaxID=2811111 RepID=A0A895YIN7_9ACTN|nr:SDR family oxidoreductase [Natronosporangium hydrolyticum]QSB13628.1 SDR family oxidoreductase [Natronosporangium hydrolyticum]